MGEEPLVSIIVNNYNYGQFLRAAIDSALSQVEWPVEVIVVDDGSTDQSREVIRSYGNRVTAILKDNGGQASALNAGYACSRGELVIFLDSDDMLFPKTARHVVDAYRDRPHVSKIMYRMETIDAAGRRTGVRKPAQHLPLLSGNLERYCLAFPFDMTWMPTSGNAFTRRVLRQIFPIPEVSFPILADFYLSHLTPLFGPVVFLDAIGAGYRVHGHNCYELADPIVDLKHVRQTIIYAFNTEIQIEKYARQLGYGTGGRTAMGGSSVSTAANRLISLKLDPALHPIHEDTVWRLLRLGAAAALGRFDVKWPMRLMLALWFLLMVVAPRSVARWLGERFLYPEKRAAFNQVLRILHAKSDGTNAPQLIDYGR
jgi:hypothetical protein